MGTASLLFLEGSMLSCRIFSKGSEVLMRTLKMKAGLQGSQQKATLYRLKLSTKNNNRW